MRIKIQTIWPIPYHFQLYTQTLGLFSSILELWGGKSPGYGQVPPRGIPLFPHPHHVARVEFCRIVVGNGQWSQSWLCI